MRPTRDQESIGAGVISPSAMRETIAQLVRRVSGYLRAHAARDNHRAASQELRPFPGAAPEHEALPFRTTLLGVEMTAHHGMDAIGADEHIGAHGLAAEPRLGVREMRDDPALVLHEALQPEPRAHRAGTEFRDDFVVDHLLQAATMDRELRIVEAGVHTALLRPHLLA
jgi:hypothetical protein